MNIAIITDGNNILGMGHVYQSLTLAGFLAEKTKNEANIFFITKSNDNVINLIRGNGYTVYHYPDDDLIFNALQNEKPDRIIFDKLDVAPDLARKIKTELGTKLIILTNLTAANESADVTVLADIGSNFQNIFRKDVATGKTEFFGPKYWILRPEFYKYKKEKKHQKETVSDILLIFGGSDPCNISSSVLNELLQIDSSFNIILVTGAAFEHDKELNIVLERNQNSKSKVQVVKNMVNVAEVMYNSDVVMASPGLSFFEALAVGTPVIGFHQDELQMKTYKNFLPTMDKSEVSRLPSIIKNKFFIFPQDPFVGGMEIGDGKDTIINEILM